MKTTTTATTTKQRWDTLAYATMTTASVVGEHLHITFADGDSVVARADAVLPSGYHPLPDAPIEIEPIHIVLKTNHGDFEVPFDVIRRLTDPEYADFWDQLSRDHQRATGAKFRARREGLGWQVDELARRGGIDPSVVNQVEAGEAPYDDDRDDRLLAAMGLTRSALWGS